MSRAVPYLLAGAAVGATTVLGLSLRRHLELEDVSMLYLTAVMAASMGGRGPALVAASLAVAAFDFCFVPPFFTFAVAETHHLLTFAVMFGAGLTISTLIERLREARDAMLRARTEELRSSLLSAVSHDMRTPLAAITGAATALRDDAATLSAATRAELLDAIVDEARRLERVLANLLGLTRVGTGFEPAREWVPVEEMVGSVLDRLADALGDREVEVAIEPDLAIAVDPVLFEQALLNLVENAIKHGAAPITVRGVRDRDRVVLEIADRGPGVAAADAGRVFDKFYRASASPGVGLGLAVVRGIVEAHRGTVAVEARPGGGASFLIVMPTAGPPPPPPLALAEAR